MIRTTCQCGQHLRARDHRAGQRAKCPSCGIVFVLPGGETAAGANSTETNPSVSDGDKDWAMYCHISSLPGLGLVLLSWVGPLLCWRAKRATSHFIDTHGKESLTFQINIAIYAACALLLGFMISWIYLVLIAVLVYGAVMSVIAAQKARAGEVYQYPGNVRLIK